MPPEATSGVPDTGGVGSGLPPSVVRALARDAGAQVVFDAVGAALGAMVGADAVWLIHFDQAGHISILAVVSERELPMPVDLRPDLGDALRRIRESRQSYRVDLREIEPGSPLAREAGRLGLATSVGVPIMLDGEVWGLAVAARFGSEPFPPETEARMASFADLVMPALAKAAADADHEQWQAEQAALRRLSELVAAGSHPDEVLQAVVAETSALLNGRAVTLTRFESDLLFGVIVAVSNEDVPIGLRLPLEGDSVGARIARSGRPARMDDYFGAPGGAVASAAREFGVRAVAGSPVMVAGRLWGMLCAISSDEPLPAGTESRLSHFAELAAASISSAETRNDLRQLADAQAALLRVAQLVARGVSEAELFDAVAREAASLIDDEWTNLARFDGPRTFTIIATCGGPAPVGLVVEVSDDDPGTVGEVIRTHRPARRDDFRLPSTPYFAGLEHGTGSGVAVPIMVEGRLWGLLGSLSEGRRLPTYTEERLQQFAELVAAAIANTQARTEVQQLVDERSALLRVAELVAHGVRPEDLFGAVTLEAAGLIDNEATTLVRYNGERTFTVLATHRGPARVGTRFTVPVDDAGTSAEVLRTGRAARLDSYEGTRGQSYARRDFGVGSSVSVPITVEGELWGCIGALTEGRRLPSFTEERLQKFADLVAAAIANTQARADIIRLANEQAALRRVAELVARGASLPEVFAKISIETSRLLVDMAAALVRLEPDGSSVVVGAYNSPAPVGLRFPLDEESDIGRALRSGQAYRVASFEDTHLAGIARDLGVRTGVAVPIVVEGRTWGALTTSTSGAAPPPDTEEKLAEFAALAAAAIANAENKALLTASRARVVATADETRRQLQRDVHDGAQQRLVQTVLTLKLARDAAGAGAPTAELIDEALRYAERATVELRDLVNGILPASLSRGGLRTGLESLLADLPIAVDMDFSAPRLPEKLETTAYFIVAEALTNVVKHAGATHASVRVGLGGDRLVIEVRDDGAGGADPAAGTGLTGLQDRVETAEGTLTITSPSGSGTSLQATLPVRGE